jgi:hypothetical protein
MEDAIIYGTLASKLLSVLIPDILVIMNSTTATAPHAKRTRKSKTQKRGRARNGTTTSTARPHADREMAAAGTLTRTKALLLAALRVWELKHRIGD